MANVIKLLPEHVASQIAAGEVIQRPASVVKELLDNSVDAGSNEISLIILDAGKALVQIIDNGMGMGVLDARMCWERHATSKIRKTEDIFTINTMGFRGEALASIASVAKVEMKTRRVEDELATYILVEGSEIKKQEAIAAPVGTNISVKNLFFNIPARRNFLKSNPVEWKHIIDEFNRTALIHPEIHFKLFHNGALELDYTIGNQQDRIISIFQDRQEKDLISLNEKTTILQLKGFIGRPESSKRIRGDQFFYVNNRFIKNNYLNHAVNQAFEGMIAKEQFPFYFIQIEIDPAKIDINIHPTKTEIKFEDERNVYQILKAVIRKSLGEQIQMPENDAFDDNRFIHRELNNIAIEPLNFLQNDATVSKPDWVGFKETYKQQRTIDNQPFENTFLKRKPELSTQFAPEVTFPKSDGVSDSRVFFQLNNQFIVTPIKSGLMVINQQLAHERILYEKYTIALQNQHLVSQQLLFPKVIGVAIGDDLILKEILPELGALGFTVNEFGKNTFVINGLPTELQPGNEQELLSEIIEDYKQNKFSDNNKAHNLAKSMAKKASIKAGTKLKAEEMNRLVDELFACVSPQISPEGKPCVRRLTVDEISKLF